MRLVHGDCLAVMATLEAASVDAIVTDPPYGLRFMGKGWDHGVPGIPFWAEALRVAKPGAHLLAFGGTRTFHRLACAIEDASWEIRDCLSWLYGSGFPKSHNGPWGGTALKPAWEPIILARKPLAGTVAANVETHGTGALNIDAARIGATGARNNGRAAGTNGIYGEIGATERTDYGKGRWPANVVLDPEAAALLDAQSGESTTPTMVTRGKGGQNGRYGPIGDQRNVPCYGDTGGASRFFYCAKASRAEREAGLDGMPTQTVKLPGKATGFNPQTGEVTDGYTGIRTNHHPTVKPLALMRWLCRLVTPAGGTILDPFTGSGTTGCAAALEGFRFVGIEREAEYLEIARQRIAHYSQQTALPLGAA